MEGSDYYLNLFSELSKKYQKKGTKDLKHILYSNENDIHDRKIYKCLSQFFEINIVKPPTIMNKFFKDFKTINVVLKNDGSILLREPLDLQKDLFITDSEDSSDAGSDSGSEADAETDSDEAQSVKNARTTSSKRPLSVEAEKASTSKGKIYNSLFLFNTSLS